jgi:hypothetical protein
MSHFVVKYISFAVPYSSLVHRPRTRIVLSKDLLLLLLVSWRVLFLDCGGNRGLALRIRGSLIVERMADPQSLHAPLSPDLRVATFADVPRMATVATAGFFYSPFFRYTRPNHKIYPEDTLLSYQAQFTKLITDEDFVVVVAEYEYDPDEGTKTDARIPEDCGWVAPEKGERVIVGVISIKLAPESKLKGTLKVENKSWSHGVRGVAAIVY